MKVKITNYQSYFSAYTIVESFTWLFGEDRIEKVTDSKFFEKITDYINPIFVWIDDNKPERKEYVKIDRWDHWSADNTLAIIIVPLLTSLRENLHGAPMVDDADVPECLRSTEDKDITKEKMLNGETDKFHFKRWEYVIDKIIWAMTQIRDDEWQEQFHTGVSDIEWKEIGTEKDGDVMYEMVQGPNNTAKFDMEGHKKFSAEIDEGTRLFGKYYRNLWS